MAREWLKGGYTPIPNGLLEAVCRLKLNGTQMKIILLVWRYTYGFHRPAHEMSIQFIASGIGVSFRTTAQEIRNLIKKKLLLEAARPSGNHSRALQFNQDHQAWAAEGALIVGGREETVEAVLPEETDASHSGGGGQAPGMVEDGFQAGGSLRAIEDGDNAPAAMDRDLQQENKEIYKELKQGGKKDLKKESGLSCIPLDEKLSELLCYYERKIGAYNDMTLREMVDWRGRVDDSLIRYAVDEAVRQDKKRWCYIRGILQHQYGAGVVCRKPETLSFASMTNEELERLAMEKVDASLRARRGQVGGAGKECL